MKFHQTKLTQRQTKSNLNVWKNSPPKFIKCEMDNRLDIIIHGFHDASSVGEEFF